MNLFESSSANREEKAGALELIMDEFWFFHGVFDKTRTLRSSVDHAAGPNSSKEVVVDSDPNSNSVFFNSDPPPQDDEFPSNNLVRTSSPPPPIESEKTTQVKETHCQLGCSSYSSLSDDPSTLSQVSRQDFNKMEKLNIPRQKLRHESTVVGTSKENEERLYMVRRLKCRTPYQSRICKNLSDLEFEEIKGFKDLGFIFKKEDIDPSIASMIPGLQDGRSPDVRRPYLSEAWFVQRYNPPNLNWVGRKSGVDVKEQLRVWARAVASNVRQGC